MPVIKITQGNAISYVSYSEDDSLSLFSILKKNGYHLNAPCAGNGFCNKCTVICNGDTVKSCRYIPNGDISVILPDIMGNHDIDGVSDITLASDITHISDTSVTSGVLSCDNHTPYSVAIDIGSTSISLALVNNNTQYADDTLYKNAVIDTCTFANPTCAYGADIISRAQNCTGKNRTAMSTQLIDSLESKTRHLIARNKLEEGYLKSIYIACNTTMQHILLSLDCSGLLRYPFKTVTFSHSLTYKNHPVYIIPSFSTFVGGDIVSGLYYLSPASTENYLFLDIGTNAEIVLTANGETYCTSAAAGPAFEGANISCGTAYTDGAICNISITPSHKAMYKTINNKIPCGICGTGILDAYSEMLNHGIIDKHKTFTKKYIDNNFEIARSQNGLISITQNDIRQIQLAISAIRTGIEILLLKSGITSNKINKVYIAGSFGSSLSFDTLKNIGILPHTLLNHDIISFVGNTSLSGAIKAAILNQSSGHFSSLTSSCTEIELATEPDFNTLFLKYM